VLWQIGMGIVVVLLLVSGWCSGAFEKNFIWSKWLVAFYCARCIINESRRR
jgi:hypothetical protein